MPFSFPLSVPLPLPISLPLPSPIQWLVALLLAGVGLRLLRSKRQYLAGVDSVFVSGDPYNVIVVHGIVTLKQRLSYESFVRSVREKFACHRRFKQRIVKRNAKWHYYDMDEAFNVNNHIKTHTLNQGSDSDGMEQSRHDAATSSNGVCECDAASERSVCPPSSLQSTLESYVSELIQTPMDMSRPPWQFVLIEEYGANGSAVIFRCHHALADGVTLMRLALTMFEQKQNNANIELNSPGYNLSSSSSPSPTHDETDGPMPMPTPMPMPMAAASSALPSTPLPSSAPFVARARHRKARSSPPSNPLSFALSFLHSCLRLLLLRPDPFSRFKPMTNITPRIAVHASWLANTLPLNEIKQMAYETGASVNDILFSIVAGGLREYCRQQAGSDADAEHELALLRHFTSIMWVSLQGTDLHAPLSSTFGNRIGAVYLRLPLQYADPIERLMHVRDMTTDLAGSTDPIAAMLLMKLLGLLPQCITAKLWNALAYKTTSSISNVPGPQNPVCWEGAEIDRMVFFVPPQGTIASFMTILSYNGGVSLGFLADSRIVDEPRKIIQLIVKEYHRLKHQLQERQTKH